MANTRHARMTALQLWVTASTVALGLSACGGGDSVATPPQQAKSFAVAKAQCGTGDKHETGLQGQVPLSAQVGGFKGFNCNLETTSTTPSSRGEGVFGMFAMVQDKSGRRCGYTSGAFNDSFGMSVVDLTDPAKAVETVVLKTPGVIQAGESLRVHEGRGLLVANYYNNVPTQADVNGGFDVYDVGTDCRYPQLLASTTNLTFASEGLKPRNASVTLKQPTERTLGHEGWFAPDGLTYYEGNVTLAMVHAIDITDPTKPKVLDTFQHPSVGLLGGTQGVTHGGSVSNDGNRGYFVNTTMAMSGIVPQTGEWYGGYSTVDTSEIQSRKPGGKMKFISAAVTRDLSGQQQTIPVTIAGNKYVIVAGEGGGGQINKGGVLSACAAGVIPFATAQLFYMGDENNPQLINKTMLEAQDPKNCSKMPEIDSIKFFLYDVHHCTVDNRDNATTLACGNFFGGIRVFDIRDPQNFKEIAYYVPPAKPGGAVNVYAPPQDAPKWCAAPAILDVKTSSVYSWCADTGIVALKFTNGAWPFPESSTPSGKQF
ncbi:MAG: hypothetical protein I8H71_02555 [Xanthomonadaceae bacterium]|nr:hypothetical protein [Xanthomonadaceae bacterium]